MADSQNSKTRPRGRPRSDTAHKAILAAALRLIKIEGFRALSIDRIAHAANVGRATIYRRWPNKAALIMDAFLDEVGPLIEFPQGGTSAERIRLQMHRVSKSFTGVHGKLIKALLGEAQFDHELEQAFRERWIEPRRREDRNALLAGIESGELRPDIDIDTAIDEIFGAIYYRLLIGTGPLDVSYMDALFTTAMAGLSAQAPRLKEKSRKSDVRGIRL